MNSLTIIREDENNYDPSIDNTSMNFQRIVLTQALYGINNHVIDVTGIVKTLNLTHFQVTNQLFTDPCVGQVKLLVLIFNDGCQRIYREGCIIDSITYEIYPKDFIKATYGHCDVYLDVTDIVRQQQKEFYVCNEIFTDPCPSFVKSLTITFENNRVSYPEHSLVNPSLWTSPPMRICL